MYDLQIGKIVVLAGIAIAAIVGIVAAIAFSSAPAPTDSTAQTNAPEDSEVAFPPVTETPDQTDEPVAENDFAGDDTTSEDNPVTTDSSTVVYEVYTEPQYRAFTMLIPAGWQGQSQVQVAANALSVGFAGLSPDQTAGIQFENPRAMRYSHPYDGQEGVVTFGGTHTQYVYRTADRYVSDILIPEFRQTLSDDVQLVNQFINVDLPGVSQGFFELIFTRGGTEYTMQLSIGTAGTIINDHIPEWSANVHAVSATSEEFPEFAEIGWNAIGSKRANPDFVRQYIGNVGDSPGSDSDVFFNALHAVQQSESRLDAGFQGFSEATLGTHTASDPNGNTYTVTNAYSNWYVGSTTGRLYGTNTNDLPTDAENLQPLQ